MARTRYRHDSSEPPLFALPAAAMRAVLSEGYSWQAFRRDAFAGVVVGMVALPLAMALAIAAGIPPQYGLYTAIVAGVVVGLLGGSRTQVSGPTAAFVVVLGPLYAEFGLQGLLLSGALAGLLLILMGLFRLGRFIQYIPYPVTTGFTSAIGTVIAVYQVKDFFGLQTQATDGGLFSQVTAIVQARHTLSPVELAFSLGTLGILLSWPRLNKRIPAPLVALPLAGVAGVVLARLAPDQAIATVGSRFTTIVDGVTFRGVPPLPPELTLPWSFAGSANQAVDVDFLIALLPGALAIALLGAIESLLSAVVADGMTGNRHDPDAELIALGVGNVVGPFFSAIPSTGAIARTATNIRAGGRTPIATVVHGLLILAAVMGLAPLLSYLPMSALSALLLLVAWNMAEAKLFARVLRIAPMSDVAVLLVCYVLTVSFDMVVGVSVGMVLASFLFMHRMAQTSTTQAAQQGVHASSAALPDSIAVYEVSGPLFFGAAQKAVAALGVVAPEKKALILMMDRVPSIDATGLVALESAIDQLGRQGCHVVLSALLQSPKLTMDRAGLFERSFVSVANDFDAATACALAQIRPAETQSRRQRST